MINDTLINNWNGHSFGVAVGDLAGKPEWRAYDAYFFLKKELNVTSKMWHDAKRRGEIRHCKIYGGKFLDYVVRKEFATFQEWLADAGGKMEDVLYGVNRIHKMESRWNTVTQNYERAYGTPMYVELALLLKHLGYVEPPKIDVPEYRDIDVDEMTKQIEMLMADHDLSISNLWVIHDGTPVQWTTFIRS